MTNAVARTCTRCRKTEKETEFYSGRGSSCKACSRARMRKYRARNRSAVRAADKRRDRNPARVAARLAYSRTERGKKANAKGLTASRKRSPEKIAARNSVSMALRSGSVSRAKCRDCGSVRTEAHHHDYSKPLDIVWLCRAHHLAEHARIKETIR